MHVLGTVALSVVCDMTHSYVSHDSFTCVTWLIYTCDMTHSSEWCAINACTWHCGAICSVWHDAFICVTWLIHVRDMIHSCAWHDSFMSGAVCSVCYDLFMCFRFSCDMTHSRVWHDWFIRVTWLIQVSDARYLHVLGTVALSVVCDMTHLCV